MRIRTANQPKFAAHFPHEALVGTVELSSGTLLLLTLLDEAPDVRTALQRFAEREALKLMKPRSACCLP